MSDLILGIDLGSVTAKIVLITTDREILEHRYTRHRGHPGQALLDALEDMFSRHEANEVVAVGVTGSGGKRIAPIVRGVFINEVIAESLAVSTLHPGVRSIINIGGQDSKLILIKTNDHTGQFTVDNFSMNTLCAAGTGAFLDQQAHRLGINIEDEFGELALRSTDPPRIAGRCSVFAKSDMIHLQQKGTALHDIVAGLCYAMARNFKATIGKNMPIERDVAFIGGVARNRGMVKAFEDVLGLAEGDLIIPQHNSLVGAIGAAYNVIDRRESFAGLEGIREYLARVIETEAGFEPLSIVEEQLFPGVSSEHGNGKHGEQIEAFLGVDVGSISTNLVLMDGERRIIAKQYLRTGTMPIEAVKRGLAEIGRTVGDRVEIVGACTTGSGRHLLGDFIGADLVKDEITCHARGAREIDPTVDTIFEIGGQDSKYISIDNGAIVDFEMNKVCAAGTGSFLEEQAERLEIDIREEFSTYALRATEPSKCGERCTVFMESDLIHHQQRGSPKEDIVAGLAYSIVYNYINKVVEGRRIGDRIFFQGGVAFNKAVAAAFEAVTGKAISVPPHHEVMGAYGAALLAQDLQVRVAPAEQAPAQAARGEAAPSQGAPAEQAPAQAAPAHRSRFKGWKAAEQEYEIHSFECGACANLCTINRVSIERDTVFYYGGRCDKYETRSRAHAETDTETDTEDGASGAARSVPDYFAIRDTLLRNTYDREVPAGAGIARVGIPLSMTIYEDYPFWKAFFTEIGCEIVLSSPTNDRHVSRGLETVVEETCFPIKALHGHILELADLQVDYIFLPYMMDMWSDNARLKETLICTYVQTAPDMVRAALDLEAMGVKLLSPIVKPSVGKRYVVKELFERVGRGLNVTRAAVSRAVDSGMDALERFRRALHAEGEKALADLEEDEFAVAIISRPYNGPDRGINLDIPRKINSLGFKAIPMDFLPLRDTDVQEELPNMYWWFGHRALSATKIIRDHPKLFPLFINNFACGPDSFSLQYFLYMMGDKPNLIIEVDEHSADAGIMTRLEAFIDSLRTIRRGDYRHIRELPPTENPADIGKNILTAGKTLYLPYITDHNFPLEAVLQAYGLNAKVLPATDEESMHWARKHTNSKECFPYVVITGDIVKMVNQPGFDPDRSAFFMPAGNGVCRLNHYESMQRLVLRKLGYGMVDVYAPSAEKAMIDMGRIHPRLPMDAWTSVVASDILFRALRQTKPYETEPGRAMEVYHEAFRMLCDTVRSRGSVINTLKIARRLFDGIPVDKSRRKPRIGIIGEFYLRWHPYSNNNIIDLIEEMGGEVVAPTVAENMLHFNHVVLNEAGRKKRAGEWTKMFFSDRWQHFQEHRLYAPFADFLDIHPEPSVQELEDLAGPYVDEIIENEITISMGKARWLVEQGHVNGVINLIPFTCLLGTPIAAFMKTLKKDYPDAAMATFKFDGAADVNIRTRLEAFMHQATQYAHGARI